MQASRPETMRVGDFELRFLVDDSQGSNDLVIFEFSVPPGARVPAPHYHRDVDEAVYGLEGTLTTMLEGQAHEVGVGDSVFIARGKVHHHLNRSQKTARVLTVLTPGSIGRRYFEEMAQVVNGPGKPELSKIKDIMLRHGLVPA